MSKANCHKQAISACLVPTGIYAVVASIWIISSDSIVAYIGAEPEFIHRIQTVKGLLFILVTSMLLGWMMYLKFLTIYRSKQALDESNKRFERLVEHLPGMAYRCLNDKDWTMQFVSQGAQTFTGYTPEDFISGKVTYEQIIHPHDRQRVREAFEAAATADQTFVIEYRIVNSDCRIRHVWESGRAIKDSTGQIIAIEGFIIDATDRKHSVRLETERAALKQHAQTVDRTLGIVGHELKSPLTSMRAMSEMLLTDDSLDTDERNHFLQVISKETLHMADMVDDMLETSRVYSNRAQWDWGAVLLAEVCKDAVELIRPLLLEKDVELSATVTPEDLEMQGDTNGLRRVIINLLSNASRYTEHGHIRILAQREDDGDQSMICIRVEDTGMGIPVELRNRIGVPFALSRQRDKRSPHRSTGLGLAICRQVVAAHHGRISMHSEIDRGTVFEIRLPQHSTGPAKVENPDPIEIVQAAATV